MDGSAATYLRDLPGALQFDEVFGLGRSDGILYVEDFDTPPAKPKQQAEVPPVPVPVVEPVYSRADLEAAREAGRQAGLQEALDDAHLVQAQLQAAATQALADSMAASRAAMERVVKRQAEGAAGTVLAILLAAVPHAMAKHAEGELQAVIASLLPGLRSEPELRVRAHPDLADYVRETLSAFLAADGGVLAVSADPLLAPGDLQIFWQDGCARRDCSAIYAEIVSALAPLRLPALEEIFDGERA
jgi:hypothetical protein